MNQLENLLKQCIVKLSVPGRLGWGTGFFVAPEWILTCAPDGVTARLKAKTVGDFTSLW